ncbi:hypothetical protein CEQ90_13565 [Lewinellaceae bacterium SD302]|nr:hypothetical protein CEQ90_13565 [Lewinellaceae bacterium SD302]
MKSKLYSIVCYFCWLPWFCQAQEANIDSAYIDFENAMAAVVESIDEGKLQTGLRQLKELENVAANLKTKRDLALAEVYSRQTTVLDDLGDFDEALRYVDLVRLTLKGREPEEFLLRTYIEEASIWSKTGRYELVMPNLREGLRLARRAEDRFYIGRFNRLLASYAVDSRDSIPIWLERAQVALSNDENKGEVLEVDMTWVRYWYYGGSFEKVLEVLRPHLEMCVVDSPPINCRNISFYQAVSLDTLNRMEEAEYWAKLGVRASKKFADPRHLRNSYDLLSWVQYKRGKMRAAYDNLYEAMALGDTIFRDNLENALADERVRQNVAAAEEDKLAAEVKAELLTARNRLWIGLALALGLLLAVGGFLLVQLQRARRHLSDNNRKLAALNATKDKFFGLIAHDLRSPVVAFSGVGEQMRYYLEKEEPEKMKRLAERVEQTADGLSGLLDNLLNWALLQRGMIPYQPERVCVAEVFAENEQLFHEMAERKRITINCAAAPELQAYADPRALSTVVRNLLSNALKFSETGQEVKLMAKAEGDRVLIEVIDAGTGISPERLEKLFALEKHSTKGTAGEKGSGLGLRLVGELVELNRGEVSVSSEPGLGSCFRVRLPR